MILTQGEGVALDAARVRTADGVERLYMGGGGVGLDAEAARFASGVYRKMREGADICFPRFARWENFGGLRCGSH